MVPRVVPVIAPEIRAEISRRDRAEISPRYRRDRAEIARLLDAVQQPHERPALNILPRVVIRRERVDLRENSFGDNQVIRREKVRRSR